MPGLRQLGRHIGNDAFKQCGKLNFFQLFQHAHIGAMPCMERAIRRYKHRKIIIEDSIETLCKAVGAKAFTDNKSIRHEDRQFVRVEPEISQAPVG